MSIDIVAVSSSRDLRRFVDLPWQVCNPKDHPQWVPPLRIAVRDALDTKNNPFYREAARELFLALRNGKPVGRIAAIENRAHNNFHDDRVGFFGFFECKEDQEAANALFDAAESWLRERRLDTMRGPMNPSTNHECGMLVDGFEHHPMIMTTWNERYYPTLVDAAGFVKAKDLLAYRMSLETEQPFALPERYQLDLERVAQADRITFRDIDLRDFPREIERCWEIYNQAWEKNWGFFPMSHDSFVHEAQILKFILWKDLTFVVEVNGDPAAFAVLLPDYHRAYKAVGNGRLLPTGIFKILAAKPRLKGIRIAILGIKPKYRTRSIFALFASETYKRGKARGLVEGEASWIVEDNDKLNRPLRSLGLNTYRRWRIYDRAIRV